MFPRSLEGITDIFLCIFLGRNPQDDFVWKFAAASRNTLQLCVELVFFSARHRLQEAPPQMRSE